VLPTLVNKSRIDDSQRINIMNHVGFNIIQKAKCFMPSFKLATQFSIILQGWNKFKWVKIYVKRSIFCNLYLYMFMCCHFNNMLIIESCVWLLGWKHTTGGHFGHFHNMYEKYIFAKHVAFNFGFHFWCLGLIFWFS
jgi:hypothetical protein